jgi:hypothetical protein
VRGRRPARRHRLLPVDLTQDRLDDGIARDRFIVTVYPRAAWGRR